MLLVMTLASQQRLFHFVKGRRTTKDSPLRSLFLFDWKKQLGLKRITMLRCWMAKWEHKKDVGIVAGWHEIERTGQWSWPSPAWLPSKYPSSMVDSHIMIFQLELERHKPQEKPWNHSFWLWRAVIREERTGHVTQWNYCTILWYCSLDLSCYFVPGPRTCPFV